MNHQIKPRHLVLQFNNPGKVKQPHFGRWEAPRPEQLNLNQESRPVQNDAGGEWLVATCTQLDRRAKTGQKRWRLLLSGSLGKRTLASPRLLLGLKQNAIQSQLDEGDSSGKRPAPNPPNSSRESGEGRAAQHPLVLGQERYEGGSGQEIGDRQEGKAGNHQEKRNETCKRSCKFRIFSDGKVYNYKRSTTRKVPPAEMRIAASITMTLSRLFHLWTRRRLGYPTFPPTTLPGGLGFLSFKAQRSIPAPKQLTRPRSTSGRQTSPEAGSPAGIPRRGRSPGRRGAG